MLTREELEKFIEEHGLPCTVGDERGNVFVLYCSRRRAEWARRQIVEGLGYPAVLAGKGMVYVYREKPRARARVVVEVGRGSTRVDPRDSGTAVEYRVPQLCFCGSTYEIRDIFKRNGFEFEPLSKCWCRSFDTVSDLRSFIEGSLPQLIEEASSRGAEIEADYSELMERLDSVRRSIESLNRTAIYTAIARYATTRAPPKLVAEVARLVGEEDAAREIETIASELESLGDGVKVFSEVEPPTLLSGGRILVCAKPIQYLGKETFRLFMAKVRSLGLKQLPGYTFCKKIESTKTSEVWGAISSLLAKSESFPSTVERELEELSDRLASRGINIEPEDITNLVEELRKEIADYIDAVKTIAMKPAT